MNQHFAPIRPSAVKVTSPGHQFDRSSQTCRDLLEIPALLLDLQVDDLWRGRKTHLSRR